MASQSFFMNEIKDNVRCSLCLETYKEPRALPCLHTYCSDCLEQYITASKKGNQIKCPMCKKDTLIPPNGVADFPTNFTHNTFVDMYKTLKDRRNVKCKLHQEVYTEYCENCNKLMCKTCSIILHKGHTKEPLKKAMETQKAILKDTATQMVDRQKNCDDILKEMRKSKTQAAGQLAVAITQLKRQEDTLVQLVRKYTQELETEVREQHSTADSEIDESITTVEAERKHLQGCRNQIEAGLGKGTEIDIIRLSSEEGQNFKTTLQKVGKNHSIPKFTINVQCPPADRLEKSQLATLRCMLDSGRVQARPTAIAELQERPPSFTFRLLKQINLDFDPAGISCTPQGEIIVCEWDGPNVTVLSSEGDVLRDLELPKGSSAFDVEYAMNCIFVAERKKDAIMVFRKDGTYVTAFKPGKFNRLSGMYIFDNQMYLTDSWSSEVYQMELTSINSYKPRKLFASQTTGVPLKGPMSICANDTTVAVSSHSHHCVHVMDRQGNLKLTYGTTGQEGSGVYQLHHPQGVILDSANRLIIADYSNHRICIVSAEQQFHHIDLFLDGLEHPHGLALDKDGYLYVACGEPPVVAKYEYGVH